MSRTKLEKEANDLDLEMYRLICRLEDFTEDNLRYPTNAPVDEAVSALRYARNTVRKMMHHADIERTREKSFAEIKNAFRTDTE